MFPTFTLGNNFKKNTIEDWVATAPPTPICIIYVSNLFRKAFDTVSSNL